MSWADKHINLLKQGKTVQFRPIGKSMSGKIESMQLVTVEPTLKDTIFKIDDIVLCEVQDKQYLHLIKDIEEEHGLQEWFQIGNNKGRINGWINRTDIFGKCIKVED